VSRLGSSSEARWITEEAASGPWPSCLDEPVSSRAAAYFDSMVTRRAAGEPLQYVLGRWSFRQLELVVDRRVLIPRPETEQVVEVALAELAALVEAGPRVAAGPRVSAGPAAPAGSGGSGGPAAPAGSGLAEPAVPAGSGLESGLAGGPAGRSVAAGSAGMSATAGGSGLESGLPGGPAAPAERSAAAERSAPAGSGPGEPAGMSAAAGSAGMSAAAGAESRSAAGPVISARAVGASDAVISVGAAAPASGAGPVVVDLGTGSGAIALSIAAEGHPAEVWATDASADALAIARANLVGLGGFRAATVRLVQGWWWDALPVSLVGRISLVVSNPPYVSTAEMSALPPVVADWEPGGALHGGLHGLDAIEVIVAGAPEWLARPGVLVVELAPHQASAAVALARAAGFREIRVVKDLAGRDRTLVGRFMAPD